MSSTQYQIKRLGGSPEVALSGKFKIDTNSMLEEAWKMTNGTKTSIIGGALIFFSIVLLLTSLIGHWFPPVEHSDGTVTFPPAYLALLFVLQVTVIPLLMSGLFMMGLKNSVAHGAAYASEKPVVPPNKPMMVFDFFRNPSPIIATEAIRQVILTSCLVLSVVGLGLVGFALWLFFAVVTNLAIPLVIKDQLSPMKAVKVSIQVSARKFFSFFILYFVMVVLFVLAAIPFGLGLIWIVPMYYNLIGILYREVFGIETPVDQPEEPALETAE